MKYVDEFGRFSGLGIHWEKSMLLPLDPLPAALPSTLSLLKVVSTIKFFGIIMSAYSQAFILNNIAPLISRFQIQSKLGISYLYL